MGRREGNSIWWNASQGDQLGIQRPHSGSCKPCQAGHQRELVCSPSPSAACPVPLAREEAARAHVQTDMQQDAGGTLRALYVDSAGRAGTAAPDRSLQGPADSEVTDDSSSQNRKDATQHPTRLQRKT